MFESLLASVATVLAKGRTQISTNYPSTNYRFWPNTTPNNDDNKHMNDTNNDNNDDNSNNNTTNNTNNDNIT